MPPLLVQVPVPVPVPNRAMAPPQLWRELFRHCLLRSTQPIFTFSLVGGATCRCFSRWPCVSRRCCLLCTVCACCEHVVFVYVMLGAPALFRFLSLVSFVSIQPRPLYPIPPNPIPHVALLSKRTHVCVCTTATRTMDLPAHGTRAH